MVQRRPETYRLDPDDPRAPSQDAWDRMTTEQRARVVALLPTEVSGEAPGDPEAREGALHRKARIRATDTLDAYFRRIERKAYVAAARPVFYPDEACFAPDVLVVLDVEPHERAKWVVAAEGRGLDSVIEIRDGGDVALDQEVNAERYARLGIREYFIFDPARRGLRGYRLPRAEEERQGRAFRRILPQRGRYTSEVLGLDLMLEADNLRFLLGAADVRQSDELVAKLGAMLDQALLEKKQAKVRAAELAHQLAVAQEKANRVEALERELAEAVATIEKLKRGG